MRMHARPNSGYCIVLQWRPYQATLVHEWLSFKDRSYQTRKSILLNSKHKLDFCRCCLQTPFKANAGIVAKTRLRKVKGMLKPVGTEGIAGTKGSEFAKPHPGLNQS